MKINTFAAGAATGTIPYCPQRIGIRFNATGGFTGFLTVTSNKRGQLVSLSEAGLKAWAQSNEVAVMDATEDVFYVELAAGRGIDPDETLTYNMEVTGASGIDVYAKSENMNLTGIYYQTMESTVVAQTNECVEKFNKFVILAMGATDDVTYVSVDGVNEKVAKEELETVAGMFNGSTDLVIVYNNSQLAKAYYLNTVANRTIVKQNMAYNGSTDLQVIANGMAQSIQQNVGNSAQAAKNVAKAIGNQKLLSK